MIVRPATVVDAGAVADIDLSSRAEALPFVRWAHPPHEVREWIAGRLIPGGGVTVAEHDGRLLGYMALHDEWVAQLYIRPGHWRQGIGTALLARAKAGRRGCNSGASSATPRPAPSTSGTGSASPA
jgi:GNAT superfamily N-acetyltransferase